MKTTVIIRSDMRGGMVMYPHNQEFTWFTFKVSGGKYGLLVEWLEVPSFKYSFGHLNEASVEIIKNIKEMLTLHMIGDEVVTRIVSVDI